ncbi:reverse transcriptase domain-containing protein [Tanacetum coccineum]
MLRALPMSLSRAASRWLRNKPSGSITTWEDLNIKFLSKYCPSARTAKKIEEINNFHQEPKETLYQSCERFKELLMKYPQHYLTKMQEVILFYNGLDVPTRQIIDLKGAIPSKTAADVKVAIQEWLNTLKKGTMEYLGQEDVNKVKAPTIPKIAHSKKKVKPLNKLTTLNLVDLSKEGDIKQQLQDSTRGKMQTLRIKNEDNL